MGILLDQLQELCTKHCKCVTPFNGRLQHSSLMLVTVKVLECLPVLYFYFA